MLWERKPASLEIEDPEPKHPEFVPVNMRKPKKAWTDSVGATPSQGQANETVLGRSVVLKGQLCVKEDIVIEGQFEGSLSVSGRRVTIGPQAIVKSDICAGEAIVVGTVQGNISAQHRIEIRKTGHAVGDLVAPGIVIESGAYFKGKIEVVNQVEKQEVSWSVLYLS
jgi:cytoskeletal protein CcmA (bactofilin family)